MPKRNCVGTCKLFVIFMHPQTSIPDGELLMQSKKWINIAYICGVVATLFASPFGVFVNSILLYVAFSKLKQHNVQALSHFARLMLVQVLTTIVCITLLWNFLEFNREELSNPTESPVHISVTVGIVSAIISIGGILAGYVGCVACTALLKNPQIKTQCTTSVHKLYMMMFLGVPIWVLLSLSNVGIIADFVKYTSIALYIPCFIYYRRFFKDIEKTSLTNNINAQEKFSLKDSLLHPSFAEKGFFISLIVIPILWGILFLI